MNRKINQKKYENVILYLCRGLGGSISGKKKLAKLLYYVDFDHFEYRESMKSITGDKYKAWRMGPVPDCYMEIVDKLEKEGKLKRRSVPSDVPGMNPTEVFEMGAEPDESVFSEDEKYILDRVIKKYGGLTGKQLEVLTHQEAPFVATDQSEEIAYELSFYRGTEFENGQLAVA
ncbi:SocA family protein [Candidatus Saccharibacteria bacterium]|nr:SocA family protein [Candidatus Saccharibacteria bacterium]